MTHELKMANIGLMAKYMGIEVKQMEDGIFILTETKYHIVSIHEVTWIIPPYSDFARNGDFDI